MAALTLDKVLSQVASVSEAQTSALKNAAAEKFTVGASIYANSHENPLTGDAEYRTVQSMAESLASGADAANMADVFAQSMGLKGKEAITVAVGQKMQESFQKSIQLGKQIDELESQTFLDNPLQWLSTQILGNPLYNQHNAEVKTFNNLNQGMQDLNARAQQFAQTAVSTAPGLSVEAQKTKVDALQNKLASMRTELDSTSHLYNAEAYSLLASAEGHTLQSLLQAKSLQYEAVRLKLAQDAAARAQESADGKADTTDEDAILQYYQAGHMSWFGKEDKVADTKTLFRLYNSKGNPASARIRALVEKGMTLMAAPMDQELSGSFGTSPVDSYNNIAAVNIPMAPAAKQTYEALILPAVREAMNPEVAKTLKTPEERMNYVNTTTSKLVASYTSNVQDKDGTNPFLIQPLATFATKDGATHSEVTKTQLWKKVFAPAIGNGGLKTLDHQELFDLTKAAIDKKLVSADQAATDLAAIVGYSSALNASLKQFRRFGLPEIGNLPYSTSLVLYDWSTAAGAAPLGLGAAMGSNLIKRDMVNLKNANSIKQALLIATTFKAKLQESFGMDVLVAPKKGK